MKQAFIAGIIVLSVLTAGSIIYAVQSSKEVGASKVAMRKIQSEVLATKQKLDEATETLTLNQQTIAFLENKITKLRSDLSNSTAETVVANQRAGDLQRQLEDERESSKRYAANIPKPVYLANGTPFFSKVVGVGGGIILTNATFSQLFGSRVIFQTQDGTSKPIQVDDLNPVILQYLQIDRDAAKVKQHELDAASATKRQADYDAVAKLQQAYAIQNIANAKIAIEQQKAADEKAARDAALETERIKANAAMVDAQKPPNQINIIQQSQQNQHVGF